MNKHGKIIAPGTIRFERLLPGPITRVWAYLVESDKRSQWLAAGDIDLSGGKIELRFSHADLSPHPETPPEKYQCYEHGNSFTGKILQCVPPHILRFTWEDGSEVTIDLSEEGDQVLLVLVHGKLDESIETRISVASGWHTHLGILEDRLAGKTPKGFWVVHNQMEKEYTTLL